LSDSQSLAGPIRCSAEHLVGNEPFAVLLADDLMVGPHSGMSVMARWSSSFRSQQSILAVQALAEQTRRYGIVLAKWLRAPDEGQPMKRPEEAAPSAWP
jgi:UTP--glucose-1-phosphate uridylyltransferase